MRGIYLYKGYRLTWCEDCHEWKAVNIQTDCEDYHAKTREELKGLIDKKYIVKP